MEKSKLYLTNGEILKVSEFQPKKSNLIKVRLHTNDEDGEGIWACVNDDTMKKYKNDKYHSEYNHYATLRNDALAFYPNSSWGMVMPIKFNGTDRPECNIDIIDFDKIFKDNDDEPIFNKLETI